LIRKGEKESVRNKARGAVAYALKNGTLKKPDACEKCGTSGVLTAHHTDYAKQLEVIWLCLHCHIEAHRNSTPLNRDVGQYEKVSRYLYVDEELKEQIEEAAKQSKLSVSCWIQQAALEKLRRDKRKEGK
jgi:ribosomal protein S27AE